MVHLENNAFTGTLPTELSDLPNALEIVFSGNNFSGSVDDVCASDKSWNNRQSDCQPVAPPNDHSEIKCECCTSCCNVNDGEDCEAM